MSQWKLRALQAPVPPKAMQGSPLQDVCGLTFTAEESRFLGSCSLRSLCFPSTGGWSPGNLQVISPPMPQHTNSDQLMVPSGSGLISRRISQPLNQRVTLKHETKVRSWDFYSLLFCDCRPLTGLYSKVRSRVWLTGS